MALRLPAPPQPPGRGPAAGPGPVVLFLPAHDEEATVAPWWPGCPQVAGRRVECLVVDDGSGDRTAELAAAGATVLSVAANRGWGRPSAWGWLPVAGGGRGRLLRRRPRVRPGRAGAAGRPHPGGAGRLRGRLPLRRRDPAHAAPAPPRQPGPHRALLRFVARALIGDGQSGFRAPSRRPRPTPRSSTTTTTRSSPSTCWPRAGLPGGADQAPVPPVAAPSSAPCATCAGSSRRCGSSSTRRRLGVGPRPTTITLRPARSPIGPVGQSSTTWPAKASRAAAQAAWSKAPSGPRASAACVSGQA